MRPFLLLSTRAEDAAADSEYAAFLRCTGLPEAQLQRVRLEQRPLEAVDLTAWSGIFLGGGPFNSSDPFEHKSAVQRRVERDLGTLLDAVTATDFPFFGACYGIGTLGTHQGATVDDRYREPVGPVRVELTGAGARDPLFAVLPRRFDAFTGHKEAVASLPPHAVRLAGSDRCPVQAFRVGANGYATQFHPELDAEGLCLRIAVYRDAGYFAPAEVAALQEQARAGRVTEPPRLLARFVELYGAAPPVEPPR